MREDKMIMKTETVGTCKKVFKPDLRQIP